jgi:hypothetical protein
MSPRRPAGRTKVPTVREKAATVQLCWPGLVVPSDWPMTSMGTTTWPRLAWVS